MSYREITMIEIHCPQLPPQIAIDNVLGRGLREHLLPIIALLLFTIAFIILTRFLGDAATKRWLSLGALVCLLWLVRQLNRYGDQLRRIQRFHRRPSWHFVALEVGDREKFAYPSGHKFSLAQAWTFQGFSKKRYLLALSNGPKDFIPLDPQLRLFRGLNGQERQEIREILDDALFDAIPQL